MVNSYKGREAQSIVNSFTKRGSDAAASAAGLVLEPESDDFTDEGDDITASPPLSAGTTTMADSMDVAALAEVALPHYISVTRRLYQTP